MRSKINIDPNALMRFTSAARVATPAINVRRLFHCFALRAAVLIRLRGAGTRRMCAFLSIVSRHGLLLNLGLVLRSSASANKVENERDQSEDQK
jgi:hypothetical protein